MNSPLRKRRRFKVVAAVLCTLLALAVALHAQNQLVDFDADTPGLPPAIGGPGQPTFLFGLPGTTILVQSSANGIGTQPVELAADMTNWVALVGIDFTPVSSGTVRIEATVAFDRLVDGFFLQTGVSIFGTVVTRLNATSAGEIQDDRSRTTVGHYAANQPFRVRMDIDMTSSTWSVAIDNAMNGFGDDPTVGGLPFENPIGFIPYVGAVDPSLGIFPTIDLPASVAYDDIAVIFDTAEQVTIDIKPDSDPNGVSLSDRGVLPVAILGSATLDASEIDPGSIELGGVKVAMRGSVKVPKIAYSLEDVNRDGYSDLMAFFSVQQLVSSGALTSASTALTLSGSLLDGTEITGTDSVRVVP